MDILDEIDSAYKRMEEAACRGWTVSEVEWPCLVDFHDAFRKFEDRLKLLQVEDTWQSVLRFYRKLRYFLVATPLPPGAILRILEGWIENPGQYFDFNLGGLDEEVKLLYERLNETLVNLRNEDENPLSKQAVLDIARLNETLVNLRNEDDNPLFSQSVLDVSGVESPIKFVAVLSPENRLSDSIFQHLSRSLGDEVIVKVLRPNELKSKHVYDEILVFGPSRGRFVDGSGFIYTSPRAGFLRVYTPSIFPTSIPTPYCFAGSPHQKPASAEAGSLRTFAEPSLYRIGGANGISDWDPTPINQDWLTSLHLLTASLDAFQDSNAPEEWERELVLAKQVLLGADHAAFLDSEGSIYRMIREQRSAVGNWTCVGVEHADVQDIGVGDVLLFQAVGGGNMLSELANQLLGDHSEPFRAAQELWKSKLRERVRRAGADGLLKQLTREGSRLRTVATVKGWCKSCNIGPGSWRDFERLLNILGISAEMDRIFEATREIRRAHKSAGFKLAAKLLELMKGKDLSDLMGTGVQEFCGSDKMANRKVAYEVVAVLPEVCEIHPGRLNQPFPLH